MDDFNAATMDCFPQLDCPDKRMQLIAARASMLDNLVGRHIVGKIENRCPSDFCAFTSESF
jgi:hypothetical protein